MTVAATEQGPLEIPYDRRENFFRELHTGLVAKAIIDGQLMQVNLRPEFNEEREMPEVYIIANDGIPQKSGALLYNVNDKTKFVPSLAVEDVRRIDEKDWMGPARISPFGKEGLIAHSIKKDEIKALVTEEPVESPAWKPNSQEMADKARQIIGSLPDADIQIPSEV